MLRTQRNSSLTLGVEKRVARAPRGEWSGFELRFGFGFRTSDFLSAGRILNLLVSRLGGQPIRPLIERPLQDRVNFITAPSTLLSEFFRSESREDSPRFPVFRAT